MLPVEETRATRGLVIGFVLVIVLLLSLAGVGIAYLTRMKHAIDDIVDVYGQQYQHSAEMYVTARERVLQLHAIMQQPDPFLRDELVPHFHALGGRFRGAREALLALPLSAHKRALLEQQARYTARSAALQEEVLDLALADRRQEAERLLMEAAMPAQDQATRVLRRLLDLQTEDARAAAAEARAEYRWASGLVAGGAAAALALAGVIAFVVVRRQARLMARLAEREREARILLEHIPEPVWYKDAAGRIVWFNPRFARLAQRPTADIAGKREADLWPDAAGVDTDQGSPSPDDGQPVYRDLNLPGDTGVGHYVITDAPIAGADGGRKGVLCVARDLTHMERMNELLINANQELQSQKTALDEHAIVSIADTEGRITYVNDKFCALSGYSREELLGQNHRLLKSGAHADDFYAAMWRTIAEGGVWHGEVCNHDKAGRPFWVDSTIVPFLDVDGQPYQYVSIRTDITARKRLEDSLQDSNVELHRRVEERTRALSLAMTELQGKYRQLERLHEQLKEAQVQLLQSEKLASIGQLAAGVAHEINNPIGFVQSNLNTLEGYIRDLMRMLDAYETAVGDAVGQTPACEGLVALRRELDVAYLKEDIPALLAESRDGIARVRQIVQDLKDFSRLDSSPEWQYADLRRGLDSTLNIAHNEIKYKADVVKEYGDVPEIECLPSQLNQVFMNLMVNAAHAIDGPRGTITIRALRLGEEVAVEVSDTGRGIPPEIRERIFDPFFTTKPVGQGTGLGLSLAYGIVQKHHGRIEVESEVGRGTTFRVVLPVRQAAEPLAA